MSNSIRRRREVIPVLYISTEGTTEERYFRLLKKRNMGFEMQIFKSKRKNATGVVQCCLDRMSQSSDEEDRGVAVFDVDSNTAEDLEEAFELAHQKKIFVAITNPSFEAWLLMHAQTIPHGFGKEEINQKLKDHVPNYSKTADLSIFKPMIESAVMRGYSEFGDCVCESVPGTYPSTNLHCVIKSISERKIDW